MSVHTLTHTLTLKPSLTHSFITNSLTHSLTHSLSLTHSHTFHTHTHSTFPRRGIINSSVYGVTYAFSQATIFFMYAAIFRFGAYQVTLSESNIAHETFEDVFRVFTALIFGAISVGQAGAFAPNYTKARISANRIFHLLDRVPLIDGYSIDGETLVRVCVCVDPFSDGASFTLQNSSLLQRNIPGYRAFPVCPILQSNVPNHDAL